MKQATVRLPADLHRDAKVQAAKEGLSLENAAAWPEGVTVYDRREAEEGGIFVDAPRFRAALTEEDIAAGVTFDVLDGIAKALRRKTEIE